MTRFPHLMPALAGSMLVLLVLGPRPAMSQKSGEPAPVSVGFRNDTNAAVVVQGFSRVKGMLRGGQPIVIQPGKSAFDNNVPPGLRLVKVYDYKSLSPKGEFPIQLVPSRDLQLVIRPAPNNPTRVILAPADQ